MSAGLCGACDASAEGLGIQRLTDSAICMAAHGRLVEPREQVCCAILSPDLPHLCLQRRLALSCSESRPLERQ